MNRLQQKHSTNLNPYSHFIDGCVNSIQWNDVTWKTQMLLWIRHFTPFHWCFCLRFYCYCSCVMHIRKCYALRIPFWRDFTSYLTVTGTLLESERRSVINKLCLERSISWKKRLSQYYFVSIWWQYLFTVWNGRRQFQYNFSTILQHVFFSISSTDNLKYTHNTFIALQQWQLQTFRLTTDSR